MATTLKDIAKLAEVSESAVSRALQDHPRISQATKDRVRKIALDLDFEVNAQAQGLATRRSGSIGVILPNVGSEVRHTYYLELLLSDLRTELSASGYDLILAEADHPDRRVPSASLRRLVKRRKVDGLILIIGLLTDQDRKLLSEANIPVVAVNSKPLAMAGDPFDDIPCFFTDNRQGGRLAALHLLDRGLERLVCLADEGAGFEMLDRTAGFTDEARSWGRDPMVVPLPSRFDDVRAYAAQAAWPEGPFGLFCHTDLMAAAALQGLAAQGIEVPGRAAVVGFDDIELGTYFNPPLTTVHQPREEIARQAWLTLRGLLEGREASPPAHLSVPPRLVVRGSA